MSFLSLTFLKFFAAALICYYICPKRTQNIALLAANYVFYMWVNPSLAIFLALGTLVGYLCGRMAERTQAAVARADYGLLFWRVVRFQIPRFCMRHSA